MGLGLGLRARAIRAPSETYVTFVIHGDSNAQGAVVESDPVVDANVAGISQWVADTQPPSGSPAYGYPVAGIGLQADCRPIQQNANYTFDFLSPFWTAAKAMRAAGARVDFVGGSLPGGKVTSNIGPLPSAGATWTIGKMGPAWDAREAASPGAAHLPLISLFECFNDILIQAHPQDVLDATTSLIADLRGVKGFAGAPVVVVSTTPEHRSDNGGVSELIEAGQRCSVLKGGNGFYVRLPRGLGHLHIGDQKVVDGGRGELRDCGDLIGRVCKVALGLGDPIKPVFGIDDDVDIGEGSTTPIRLACDQPVYYRLDPSSDACFAMSGDVQYAAQALVPANGIWPAHDAGTPANNRRVYTVNYRTGDGVEGSITRHIVINKVVAAGPFSLKYATADSAGTNTAEVNVTAGKFYVTCSWEKASLTVDGSTTGVTAEVDITPNWNINGYLAPSSGVKTFSAGRLLFVVEVGGVRDFNGSTTNAQGGVSPGSVDGLAVCFLVATGGLSNPGNMDLLATSDSGAGPFYVATFKGPLTPAHYVWSGFTALAAMGTE
ncbi:MAG: hypothetical protein JF595_13595 [Sphingomonadales bacterium]|nr:hypothetical protein [Sphingomonadales bacterium]